MLSIAGDLRLPATMEPSMRAAMGESERCPRCGSHNTKFCYYNNYNLAQPRHFCKSCRRYWTLGGSLRNVPIGGSTRSNPAAAPHHPTKQPHHASATTSSSKRRRASAGPFPTSASPSPPPSISTAARTLLAFDAPSSSTVSAAAKPEPASILEPASADILGSFVSLLTEPLPAGGGFLAIGDHLAHGRDEEFELGLGFGGGPKWVSDEVGFGMARPVLAWPLFVEDDGAAGLFGTGVMGDGVAGGITGERDAWQAMAKGTAELDGGDCGGCFGWPELAMTTTSGKAV
ncbi:hypothetical protein Taro_041566 [Colocasia esculenta]|uniref:Dof zinc finger protein n=1 Tax=Colocasia esculenta TaxID=4460 RepID=A0A843X0S7_COLES|nr:hypothetical protein [Colocasia esculenta]